MNAKTGISRSPVARELRAKESRLNLRITDRQDHLIRRAAAAVDKSVTEFVMDSAAAEAERVLADQRWFVLSEAEWDRFNELIDRPFSDGDRMQELLAVRVQVDLSDL